VTCNNRDLSQKTVHASLCDGAGNEAISGGRTLIPVVSGN